MIAFARALRWGVLMLAVAATGGLTGTSQAFAQDAGHPPLRIFLDCFECDTEYLRQNVLFVDYMRDRTDADLHVLVTTQSTGGGGTSWTLRIIGLGRFLAEDRQATFTTPQTATADDRRREFARQFKLALAGYAADTTAAPDLDITFAPPASPTTALTPQTDPWKLWVFRVNGNANVNGEASSAFKSYRVSFSGSRSTEQWKSSFSLGSNTNRSDHTLSDGRKIRSSSDGWNAGGTLVKSMGPRLSLGGRVNANHSTFSNLDRSVSIYPGFEFNFFPYSEFQRRSFTIWWEAGPNFYDYRELTIYDKTSETVVKQQMDVSLRLRQPWGSMGIFSSIAQDLGQLDRYSASIRGNANVRLFKGFSFNVFSSYSRIKDQIFLPRAGASTEEVLLRLRQLSTDYRYDLSIGFSYSFGSIFNSVVNPRFDGSNGFFFFF